ncbi:MAG: lytic transglycosylase domain-containing protein [Desulfobacteraceae bacterium]|nr:lytic transglycosylase domain-containing protein [Desulfobacteraceae bacterium]
MRGFAAPKPLSLLLIAILWLLPATAMATIYAFKDANGVLHLTNVPIDSRYKPLSALPPLRPQRAFTAADYEIHIREAASLFQIDPLLITAVIRAESCFNCMAVSSKGAQGLMQLMPETARDMNVRDPFDPAENILGGTRYLRKMLDLFGGDLRLALAAYNAGPERVRLLGQIPPIPETQEYVQRVLDHYRHFQAAASAGKSWANLAYD